MSDKLPSALEYARETERKIVETARIKGVNPYRVAKECFDESMRLDDAQRMKFWHSVWTRMMEDEFLVSLPDTHTRTG